MDVNSEDTTRELQEFLEPRMWILFQPPLIDQAPRCPKFQFRYNGNIVTSVPYYQEATQEPIGVGRGGVVRMYNIQCTSMMYKQCCGRSCRMWCCVVVGRGGV